MRRSGRIPVKKKQWDEDGARSSGSVGDSTVGARCSASTNDAVCNDSTLHPISPAVNSNVNDTFTVRDGAANADEDESITNEGIMIAPIQRGRKEMRNTAKRATVSPSAHPLVTKRRKKIVLPNAEDPPRTGETVEGNVGCSSSAGVSSQSTPITDRSKFTSPLSAPTAIPRTSPRRSNREIRQTSKYSPPERRSAGSSRASSRRSSVAPEDKGSRQSSRAPSCRLPAVEGDTVGSDNSQARTSVAPKSHGSSMLRDLLNDGNPAVVRRSVPGRISADGSITMSQSSESGVRRRMVEWKSYSKGRIRSVRTACNPIPSLSLSNPPIRDSGSKDNKDTGICNSSVGESDHTYCAVTAAPPMSFEIVSKKTRDHSPATSLRIVHNTPLVNLDDDDDDTNYLKSKAFSDDWRNMRRGTMNNKTQINRPIGDSQFNGTRTWSSSVGDFAHCASQPAPALSDATIKAVHTISNVSTPRADPDTCNGSISRTENFISPATPVSSISGRAVKKTRSFSPDSNSRAARLSLPTKTVIPTGTTTTSFSPNALYLREWKKRKRNTAIWNGYSEKKKHQQSENASVDTPHNSPSVRTDVEVVTPVHQNGDNVDTSSTGSGRGAYMKEYRKRVSGSEIRRLSKEKKERNESDAGSTPRAPPKKRASRRSTAHPYPDPHPILPSWHFKSDVGKFRKRCPYCAALHLENERFKCCSNGKVKFPVLNPLKDFKMLAEILEGKTALAKKHLKELCKMNTLFCFGAKQCTSVAIPGKGVPIQKTQGTYSHTASSVFNTGTCPPAFGALYVVDGVEQASIRIDNTRLSANVDPEVIEVLTHEFNEYNEIAQQYRNMAAIFEEERNANGGALPSMYFRIVPKADALKNDYARKLMEEDHTGRYNMPDQTMVTFVYKTDDEGCAQLPKGLNVYPYHRSATATEIAHFSEHINPFTYPFIHPFGNIEFKIDSIEIISNPKFMAMMDKMALLEGDVSDDEEEEKEDSGSEGEEGDDNEDESAVVGDTVEDDAMEQEEEEAAVVQDETTNAPISEAAVVQYETFEDSECIPGISFALMDISLTDRSGGVDGNPNEIQKDEEPTYTELGAPVAIQNRVLADVNDGAVKEDIPGATELGAPEAIQNRVLVDVNDEALEEDTPGANEVEDLPYRNGDETAVEELNVLSEEEEDENGDPVRQILERRRGADDESDLDEGGMGDQNNSECEEGEENDGVNGSDDDEPGGLLADEAREEPAKKKKNKKKGSYVTHMQYIRYSIRRIHKSKWAYHRVWSAARLSQHWIIDNTLRAIESRLNYLRLNHAVHLKSAKKSAFFDSMAKRTHEKCNRRLGMNVTIPRTFKGGPSYMRDKYEDTMAMIAEIGNPHLFITFTGNRKWKEIERCRKPNHTWADVADIAVRVFFAKYQQLRDLVLTKGVFGKVKGYAYSIELQQRGMPHAHLLITLEDDCTLDTPEKIDKVVWARLPTKEDWMTEEEKNTVDELRQLVEDHMVHNPCEDDDDAYCKKEQKAKKKKYKRCDKGFPKEFSERTAFVSDGYVLPKRPNDGSGFEKCIDYKKMKYAKVTNQHIVSYNPQLLLAFKSHINVEVCSTVKACKYIFKYIFKGYDKALVEFIEMNRISNGTRLGAKNMGTVCMPGGHVILPRGVTMSRAKKAAIEKNARKRLENVGIDPIDENGMPVLVNDETITYQALRSTTVPEALLAVYEEKTAEVSHTVVGLGVHEPNEERIYYMDGNEESKLKALKENKKVTSRLLGWFELNKKDENARQYLYTEIPKHYKWMEKDKVWKPRKNKTKVVSRLFTVSPRYAEQFAIRMLVMNVRGAQSFDDLKRHPTDGTICATFQEAARARGLLNDEKEWEYAMREACKTKMPAAIRRLFAVIVAYCNVKCKQALFDMFAEEMYDGGTGGEPAVVQRKRARALYHIESILKANRLTNKMVGLEEVDTSVLGWQGDEHEYNDGHGEVVSPERALEIAKENIAKMNKEQLAVFSRLLASASPRSNHRCYFLEGAGGCGKTFVYKTLYYMLLYHGIKTIMVAHTGIAACLLINGSTVHRQFCIPIDDTQELLSKVEPDSLLEKCIQETEVIIWDEATMSNRKVLECVDKLCRDLEPQDRHRPFGGKMLLLGGDWKQLLPVVRSTFGPEILDFTIKRSHLWHDFIPLKLTKNMRVEPGAEDFAKLAEKIGNGDADGGELCKPVKIPLEMCMPTEDHVIDWAYKGLLDPNSCQAIKDTCILSVLNAATLEINEKVLEMLDGQEYVMTSVDKCSNPNNSLELAVEIYHKQTPSGFPPHILKLKKGCVVMLLRNLNVPKGQCNGTRLRVVDISDNLLVCDTIADREEYKKRPELRRVLIPRVEVEPRDTRDPSQCFTRLQFPIRLAYAMTINKAQGQTLKKVGIVLRTPCFAHGQFYVGISRAQTMHGVKIWQYGTEEKLLEDIEVVNVVYRDILSL